MRSSLDPSRGKPRSPAAPRTTVSDVAPKPPRSVPRRPSREKEILRAAIEELASSDYGGLSFERVALRAGVNKTTVYRRWETKAELVRAAVLSFTESLSTPPSTGTFREDLIRIGRQMTSFISSFEGQCLMRLRLLQTPEPELADIAQEVHRRHMAILATLADEAVARGEVAPDTNIPLLLEMLCGALHFRQSVKNQPVDDLLIAKTIDILLEGVRPKPAPPARHAVASRARHRS